MKVKIASAIAPRVAGMMMSQRIRASGAVELRRVLQFPRDTHHELTHQEDPNALASGGTIMT